MLLHHVSVGVADVEKAASFYDKALRALGYRRVMEFLPSAVAYGVRTPELWVQLPHDRDAPTVGNGVHIAINAATKRAVHAFHAAALAAGGTDDGAPGPRPVYSPTYYGAFVRDLDGNKIEAVLIGAAGSKPRKAKSKQETRKATKRAHKARKGRTLRKR